MPDAVKKHHAEQEIGDADQIKTFSYKIVFRIFLFFVQICVIIITIIAAYSYAKVFKLAEKSQNELYATQRQIEMVKLLPAFFREIISDKTKDYSYFEDHLQICKEDILLGKSKYQNDEKFYYWAYSDCINMLEYLGENAKSIWERYQVEKNYSAASTLILKDIERVDGYILNKLQDVAGRQIATLQTLSDQTLTSLKQLQIVVIVCIIVFGIVIILLGQFLSHWLLNPLMLLTQHVENNTGEHIDMPFNSPTEIAILTEKYNDYIDKSNETVERAKAQAMLENDLKQERIKNLELKNEIIKSQLNFLQSQINPHFLFNALSTVSYVAGIEKAPETNELVLNITSLLRYSFRNVGKKVAIYEELNYVSNYLNICRFRYGDIFSSSISVSPKIIHFEIPALTIQPFVENVFTHGLNKRESKEIFIALLIKKEKDKIIIIVKDNGCGIPEGQLAVLNGNDCRESHGIQNAKNRLILLYGTADIKISSKEGEGTEVQITIPLNDDFSEKEA